MAKRITIAVDGFSSCGKSSFAKQIACELGYIYIDTGAMYRAVTLGFLRWGVRDVNSVDEERLQHILSRITIGFAPAADGRMEVTLDGEPVEQSIRGEIVSGMVSEVAAVPQVRDTLVAQQREIGKNGGVVMDGRDIGTVVFPNAELKLFMTADLDVRAQRRYAELKAKGQQQLLEMVKDNLAKRDRIDQAREYNPLRRAEDAVLLDNTHMNPAEQMEWLRPLLKERIGEDLGSDRRCR